MCLFMKDIMDLHTHTTASGHAYNTLYEMARSASGERGAHAVGSTDHAPKMPGTCHEFYFINFKVIPRTPVRRKDTDGVRNLTFWITRDALI